MNDQENDAKITPKWGILASFFGWFNFDFGSLLFIKVKSLVCSRTVKHAPQPAQGAGKSLLGATAQALTLRGAMVRIQNQDSRLPPS